MAYGQIAVDKITGTTNSFSPDSSVFRNRIINGAMGIWQRGTSSSSNGYLADRWSFYADSSRTVARSTDVPTGFQYSASLSGTGSTGFTQKIESINCYGIAGNSITISFWLKQTTGAGSNAIGLNLYYANAADDWNSSTQISTTQNFTTTSGWAQYSATFSNMPANSVNGLQVTIVTNSGSAVVFLLTGVQLEVGSIATSFDYRPYGTELQLCQRYCQVFKSTAAYYLYTTGFNEGTTASDGSVVLKTTMRTAPSATFTAGSTFRSYSNQGYTATNIGTISLTPEQVGVQLTISGATAGYGCTIQDAGSNNSSMTFSAEL